MILKKRKYQFLILIIMLTVMMVTSVEVFASSVDINNSCNIHRNEYVWNTASTVKSYLTYNNGVYTRIESVDDKVIVEKYNSSFSPISSDTLTNELPLFGGFFQTALNYFVVYGQENTSESDSTEVIRVVKYDKSWNRLGSASLYGANTTVPFRAGSLRMDYNNNYLAIRTSHQMYKASDGLNHQANCSFIVDLNSMSITDSISGICNTSVGYVSHSFNQFIKYDGDYIVAVDHGDAYPRSLVIGKYATPNTVTGTYNYKEIVKIPGNIGDNYTGMMVGGLEISNNKYLIAEKHVAYNDTYRLNKTANIYVHAISKDLSSSSDFAITNYSEDGTKRVSNPYLVKISNDCFLLLWQRIENDSTLSGVEYVFLDGNGQKLGSIGHTENADLSDCMPQMINGKVIWYFTNNGIPVFCQLSCDLNTYQVKEEISLKKVNKVTINKPGNTMKVGDTMQLSCSIFPDDATYKSVTWTSSDTSVATVDGNGLVFAKSAGTVWITATATDGGTSNNNRLNASDSAVINIGTNNTVNNVSTSNDIYFLDNGDGTYWVYDSDLGSTTINSAVVSEGMVYRMYNPNSGEHFYTKDAGERDYLVSCGWNYEENASYETIASTESGAVPVYRVYNPNSGLHHYTTDKYEAIMLKNLGWNYEGISLYVYDVNQEVGSTQYRLYCENDGQHHWTVDASERDYLVSIGWNYEGIAWKVK